MKLAFISDIHGNLQALEATLEDIKLQGSDALTVLGDVATLGPNPKEVIEILSDCDASFVMGNHDDMLINLYENRDHEKSSSAYEWAADKLSKHHVEFLKKFKASVSWDLNLSINLISYHASPWGNSTSIMEHIRTKAGQDLFDALDHNIFVGGHEHQQFRDVYGSKQIINAGSAGFPYKIRPFIGFPKAEAWSEYVMIEFKRGRINVDFRKVEYDKLAFYKAATDTDNPIKEWLLSVVSSDLEKQQIR